MDLQSIKTPPPRIERGCPKGPALKAGAIPLCDGGLILGLIYGF